MCTYFFRTEFVLFSFPSYKDSIYKSLQIYLKVADLTKRYIISCLWPYRYLNRIRTEQLVFHYFLFILCSFIGYCFHIWIYVFLFWIFKPSYLKAVSLQKEFYCFSIIFIFWLIIWISLTIKWTSWVVRTRYDKCM